MLQMFRENLTELLNQMNDHDWCPHTRLEFMKQSIRTAASLTEGIYKKKFNDNLKHNQTEYNLLNNPTEKNMVFRRYFPFYRK